MLLVVPDALLCQFWFSTSITQSMQWTLMAPYISSCPSEAPRVQWTAFPTLNVTNNPDWATLNLTAAISSNVSQVTSEGTQVQLAWDAPGKTTGWNASYTTQTSANGSAQWVAWISQLNTTYTPLTLNANSNNTGSTVQPAGGIFGVGSTPLLNGTVYLLITDADVYVTPYNLSEIESHILAGPALYNVG